MYEVRPRLKGQRLKAYENLMSNERRILVVGDIHLPFEKEGYLQHCVDTYERFNCNKTIFIGDIVDNNFSSYWPNDPNGMAAGDELSLAIDKLKPWSKAFPIADVTIGNHDRLIARKAFSGLIPKQWIKSYNEVLGTNWNWTDRVVYDNVQYIHGEGPSARKRAKDDMMSTVQGHRHTECYVEHFTGNGKTIFAAQTGTGIDRESYAMAYAKHHKRPALSCLVVIGGHTAINVVYAV